MKFSGNVGVTEKDIATFRRATGRALPQDYIDFLKRHNGGEGYIGGEYVMLWKLEELEEFNRDYEVREYLPNVLLFGSDGSGEAFGFRTSGKPTWEVITVPFVGMSPELCEKVAGSFSEFMTSLGKS
jgi:SMI1 / KNR4 family (SUKH-1)